MGTAELPLTTGTARTMQAEYIQLYAGRLKAVSAFIVEADVHDAKIFVELGTMLGGQGLEYRQQVLASGYVGSTAGINWTGDIPIEPTEEIYVHAWASAAATLKVRAKTENV